MNLVYTKLKMDYKTWVLPYRLPVRVRIERLCSSGVECWCGFYDTKN
jgi:hypothetical protein